MRPESTLMMTMTIRSTSRIEHRRMALSWKSKDNYLFFSLLAIALILIDIELKGDTVYVDFSKGFVILLKIASH